MRIPALVATILILTTGCDKLSQSPQWQNIEMGYLNFIDKVSGAADANKPPPPRLTSLEGKPPVLFQVFGKRSDPRVVPFAVIETGRLRPITLAGRGWREFDRVYGTPGDSLALYQDGRRVGTATVRRGMWPAGDTALYKLPGCKVALPQAAVDLSGDIAGKTTVELFASNAALGRSPEPVGLSADEVEHTARNIALLIASKLAISPRTLDSLDFRAIAAPTGVPGRPTLVINYLDPAAADTAKNRTARQVFVLADQGEFGYGPTYWHYQRGLNPNPQFRRYVDHLDLNGDGVDEIILEAWYALRPGSFYVVLSKEGAMWRERYRTDPDWCRDAQIAQIAAADSANKK